MVKLGLAESISHLIAMSDCYVASMSQVLGNGR